MFNENGTENQSEHKIINKYDEIERLARRIPKGKWMVGGATPLYAGMHPAVHHEEQDPTYCQSYEMAEYLARCDPDTILHLITRARLADEYDRNS